jgi:hypothetical protein
LKSVHIKRISQAVVRGLRKARERRKVTGRNCRAAVRVYTSDIDLIGVSAAFVEVMKLVWAEWPRRTCRF